MKLSQDEIAHQQNLLSINRRNLAHYLWQAQQFEPRYLPLHISNGLAETRANIALRKSILRGAGVEVDDQEGEVV